MEASEVPSGHTAQGGVVVGSEGARRRLVLFEDPQCPYCREFEEVAGDLLRREVAAGAVAVEYRIRCFLGVESVRAANALAAAAEVGGFDELHRTIFANQPAEHSGGFTTEDLLELGSGVGLTAAVVTSRRCATAGMSAGSGRSTRYSRSRTRMAPRPASWTGSGSTPRSLYDPEALGALIRR